MIKELKLSNFRLFGKEVTVRFRPITILIGKNNAGKSSIIKFLLMLKQSTMSAGSFLAANGNEVNLGRFYELKNKNRRMPDLVFSLEVADDASPGSTVSRFVGKHFPHNVNTYTVDAAITYNRDDEFSGKQQKIILRANGEPRLSGESSISENSTFLYSKAKDEPTEIRDLSSKNKEEQTLNRVMRGCIEKIRYDIQSLGHLSAARKELEGFAVDSPLPRHVGKEGEYTIFQLWKEKILEDTAKQKLLIKHTEQVLGINDIYLEEWDSQLAICSAKSVSGKAKINISNFGFGVSQCLPVFVQGLLMSPYSQLMFEQPEAQVHPTAQIEMGSFFVDLWKDRQVGSIIETHSDNIILRIRHHIRKGDISAQDVSVAYVTDDGKNPVIENLDIKDDGSIEGLPLKFFGGKLMETLEMGAAGDENE